MQSAYEIFSVPAAWTADDYRNDDWIDKLSDVQLRELDEAARCLPEDESEWLKLTKGDLELPELGPYLDRVNDTLDRGRGFALLRGIDLSPTDIDYAYRVNWVLAVALGDVIAQNANGEVIGPVQALVDTTESGIETRGYVSNAELRFHCDGGDVASLLCLRQAPEGGLSSLVSMISIHNIMAKECPQHLETLYRGMPMFMRKESGMDSAKLPRQPLFMPQGDHLLAWINLRLMELSYESAGKSMPANERAAFDALEEIAERPEQKMTFRLKSGDVLLVHNFSCMHKRSQFRDDPDPDKSRLMLRLWYNLPNGRVAKFQPSEHRAGYFIKEPYVIRHSH